MDADGNSLSTALYPPEQTDYKRCIRLSNLIGNLTAMYDYDQEALGKFAVSLIKKRNDFALCL